MRLAACDLERLGVRLGEEGLRVVGGAQLRGPGAQHLARVHAGEALRREDEGCGGLCQQYHAERHAVNFSCDAWFEFVLQVLAYGYSVVTLRYSCSVLAFSVADQAPERVFVDLVIVFVDLVIVFVRVRRRVGTSLLDPKPQLLI